MPSEDSSGESVEPPSAGKRAEPDSPVRDRPHWVSPGAGFPHGVPVPNVASRDQGLFEGRLHPLSLFFSIWNIVKGLLVPALILALLRKRALAGGFIFFFGVPPLIVAVIRYFTFEYRLEGADLITSEGLIHRHDRRIPLARVQDIRIEQGLLHRLFGMAQVHVDTASGEGAEATLSVLSRSEAEHLRALVFERRKAASVTAAMTAPTATEAERVLIRRLGWSDLILAGITSNPLASVMAIFLVAWGLADDVISRATIERWIGQVVTEAGRYLTPDGSLPWWGFALAGLLVLLVGMLLSVGWSVLVFYGFTLSRHGEDLHRSYGLLTRRSSSLPRRRIQVLKIEERWLRRCLKLATLRVDTAGGSVGQESDQSRTGHDVLLPVVRRREVDALLAEIFPELESESSERTWRPVSRKAVRRGTVKGVAVCAFWTFYFYWIDVPLGWVLAPLAFIPVIYALNVLSYRHLGYWHGASFFQTRRGWLGRAGHVVPVRNIQAVVLRQSPFDRWHGLGTIQVDSAGQVYTGGSPKVSHVVWAEVCDLGRQLARHAARTRYRW